MIAHRIAPGLAAAALVLLGAAATLRAADVVDDDAIKTSFEEQLEALFRAGGLATGSATLKQLHGASVAAFPAPSPPASDDGAFARARAATLVLGHLYHCQECDRRHARLSGGVVISPDGLALTCYHVLDAREAIVFGAMTADGGIHAIDEVLAASKADDLALVRLRGAKDLPVVPLSSEALRSGDELFVVSHPDGHFHSLTRGYLARRYLAAKERVPRLQITADFAKGSSGCGVFNLRGELIGLAASTSSIRHGDAGETPGDFQMAVRSAVPVESIRRLFQSSDPEMQTPK